MGESQDDQLSQLIAQHLPRLRAFVRLQMGPKLRAKESVSDVVQSVCRELLGRSERFEYRGDKELRSWLCSVTLHKVHQKMRFHRASKRDIDREVAGDAAERNDQLMRCYTTQLTPSRHAIGREQIERIEKAFDQLPERYRDVIICARILGLSHAEIGQRLGMGEGSARAMLSRALTRLSMLVETLEGEADDS